jgi:hypothetical protein
MAYSIESQMDWAGILHHYLLNNRRFRKQSFYNSKLRRPKHKRTKTPTRFQPSGL